jgi:hypothetical protein
MQNERIQAATQLNTYIRICVLYTRAQAAARRYIMPLLVRAVKKAIHLKRIDLPQPSPVRDHEGGADDRHGEA